MYVKLFSSIIYSSIWAQDAETRLTWITMLAISNTDGYVKASVSGLARAANVSLDGCRRALEVLAAPDPESSSQEHEGRRIEPTDGGWLVLNRTKYRDLKDSEQERELARERMRRHRERKREQEVSQDVTVGDDELRDVMPSDGALQEVSQAKAEAEAESSVLRTGADAPKAEPQPNWKADAAVCLRAAGVPEDSIGDSIRNFWAPARRRFTDPEIAAVVTYQGERFKAQGKPWNPAAVWNPNNEDFDSRFRWHISRSRAADLRQTRQSRGLAQLKDVLK